MTTNAMTRNHPTSQSFTEGFFGPHLMMDCRRCNADKIADPAYVFEVLNTLPEVIGMTKITQPYVFPYAGLVPEDKGVTGIVVIAESHLSFHSFTEKDYFFFDLFSCKPFDVETARRFVIDAFEVQDAEIHYVERGRHFPRSGMSPIANPASEMVDTVSPADRMVVLRSPELATMPVS